MTKRIDMFCASCGSRHVTRDATAYWHMESQTWKIAGLMDAFTCEECGDTREPREMVLEGEGHDAEAMD